jgi:hypothetical protein
MRMPTMDEIVSADVPALEGIGALPPEQLFEGGLRD